MTINVIKDTFKFTTKVFPSVIYLWNPDKESAVWSEGDVSDQDIVNALEQLGLPASHFTELKEYIINKAKFVETPYSLKEAQGYVDRGLWSIVE